MKSIENKNNQHYFYKYQVKKKSYSRIQKYNTENYSLQQNYRNKSLLLQDKHSSIITRNKTIQTPQKEEKQQQQSKFSQHQNSSSNQKQFTQKIKESINKKEQNNKAQTIFEKQIDQLSIINNHLGILQYPFFSKKSFGGIQAFAINQFTGLLNTKIDQQIQLVINLKKTYQNLPNFQYFPSMLSYFGIYQSKKSDQCAEFLKTHLLYQIISSEFFPNDIESSIKQGLLNVSTLYHANNLFITDQILGQTQFLGIFFSENYFIQFSNETSIKVLSSKKKCTELDFIEKTEKIENQRKSKKALTNLNPSKAKEFQMELLNQNLQIHSKNITNEDDFLLLGNKQVFTKINQKQIEEIILNKFDYENLTIHQSAAKILNSLLEKLFKKKIIENITLNLIAFKNFQHLFDEI